MSEFIIKNFPKTEDAVLVNKYFGYAFSRVEFCGLFEIFASDKLDKILEAARALAAKDTKKCENN